MGAWRGFEGEGYELGKGLGRNWVWRDSKGFELGWVGFVKC